MKRLGFERVWVLGALALAVSGCVSDEAAKTSSCAGGAEPVLAAADWDEAIVLDIDIRQRDFAPAVFGLLKDRPYVLRFTNNDNDSRDFEAADFFQNVALASASVADKPLDGKCLSDITVPPGETVEIRLVPVRNGRYPFAPTAFIDTGIGYESGYGTGTIFVQ